VEPLEDRTTPSVDLGFAFGLGSGSFDTGGGVATDAAGNVYVTGQFGGTIRVPGLSISRTAVPPAAAMFSSPSIRRRQS
jgi:hypothetical protein